MCSFNRVRIAAAVTEISNWIRAVPVTTPKNWSRPQISPCGVSTRLKQVQRHSCPLRHRIPQVSLSIPVRNSVVRQRINYWSTIARNSISETTDSMQQQVATMDDSDNLQQQSTMWLGTEDGCIHVYNCTDNIRTKKNKIKIQQISAVYSIL